MIFYIFFILCTLTIPQAIHGWVTDASQRYAIAIQDAKYLAPNELPKTLTTIVPWNSFITWHKDKVVAVSYMSLNAALSYYMTPEIFTAIKDTCSKGKTYDAVHSGVQIVVHADDFKTVMDLATKAKETAEAKIPKPSWIAPLPGGSLALTGYPSIISSAGAFRPSWVTIAPELQKFMHNNRHLSPNDLTTRVNELLGLPPMNDIKYIVEFDVQPQDLIRPSQDAEITDSDAISSQIGAHHDAGPISLYGLHFELFNPYAIQNATDEQFENIKKFLESKGETAITRDNVYQKWFAFNKKDTIFNSSWPFPWTQVGYTYDYSLEAFKSNNHIGLSEFIIKPESPVTIVRIMSLSAYIKEYTRSAQQIINLIQSNLFHYQSTFHQTISSILQTVNSMQNVDSIIKHDSFSTLINAYNMVLYYNEELRKIAPNLCINQTDLQTKLYNLLHPPKPNPQETMKKTERLLSLMQAIQTK